MSNEGRAQCSVPDASGSARITDVADSECAAGTFPTRLVNRPNRKPLDLTQRLALGALIASGRMIKRSDGYGTDETTLIGAAMVAFLKSRRYATPSFDGNAIFPTEKARTVNAEIGNAE